LPEALLAAAVGAGLLYCIWFFLRAGYLPQPFLYDVRAPLIGLYETAFWANHDGTYGVGENIYPPLSFVVARLFSIHRCYAQSPIVGRACDMMARWVLLAFFTLNIALVYRAYRGLGVVALTRTAAVALGLPMLYALECGNVIILTFTAFVLGCGDLLRSEWGRRIALVTAINFKPYLLVLLIPPLLRRRWVWVAWTCAAGAGLYGLTWALQGGGSPAELLRNLEIYAAGVAHRPWSDVYYATSFWPLIHYVASDYAVLGLAGPGGAGAWVLVLEILMRLAQAGVAISLFAAAARPRSADVNRLSAMILAMVLTTIVTGQSGYVQIFLFFLIFREPWRGAARITILSAAYLLCIPADITILPVIHGSAHSVLGGRDVSIVFGVSVGQLARPAVLLVIQYGLIYLNLADALSVKAGSAPADARFLVSSPEFATPFARDDIGKPRGAEPAS